jgi:hypothetical protein
MAAHERITGTGLGLPIARDLARRMGGDLDVASVRGAGSVFLLVLPGPAGAPGGLVGETLGRVLEAEERLLEERLARRAMAPSRTRPPVRNLRRLAAPRRAESPAGA